MEINLIEIPVKKSKIKTILKPWLYEREKVDSISYDNFIQREKDEHRKYPVRYTVFQYLPHKIEDLSSSLQFKKERLIDYIRLRTWDRYNVIKISKDPEYIAHQYQMLYASFSILKDFVECNLPYYVGIFCYLDKDLYKENYERYCTTEESKKKIQETLEENYNAALKIIELYVWWTVEYPAAKAADYYNFIPCKEFTKYTLNFLVGPKTKKQNGFYYVEKRIKELSGNPLKKDDKEFEEFHQKLKELYEIWPNIVD